MAHGAQIDAEVKTLWTCHFQVQKRVLRECFRLGMVVLDSVRTLWLMSMFQDVNPVNPCGPAFLSRNQLGRTFAIFCSADAETCLGRLRPLFSFCWLQAETG